MKSLLSGIALTTLLATSLLLTPLDASTNEIVESKVILVQGVDVIVPEFVTVEDITNINDIDSLDNTGATFDLTSNEVQSVLIPLENGEVGTITIEPLQDATLRGKYTLSGNQTWKIYWSTGVINMSYYIKTSVSGNTGTIKSYYDESYSVVGYKVTSESFKKSGNTVTYRLGLSNPLLSTSSTLKASVSGKTLTTSWY